MPGTTIRSEQGTQTGKPPYLRPSLVAFVFIGGSAGTAARLGLSLLIPPAHGVPYTILGINILGAFLLGILLEFCLRIPETRRVRSMRLLLGTGFMGGFTTYSALAVDTAMLVDEGRLVAGIIYGLTTVIFGVLAAWAGVRIARTQTFRREKVS